MPAASQTSPMTGTGSSSSDRAASTIDAVSWTAMAWCRSTHCRRIDAPTSMVIRGAFHSRSPISAAVKGPTVSTQRATTVRAEGLSSATFGCGGRPGTRLRRIGPMRLNRSGTPTRSATTK